MAFRVRHVGLKVVSVALAALLWLLVSGEQTVERALRVPLEFTNMPPQLELVGEPPSVVDVRVRGSSGTLSRVAAGELAAVLDVRTARSGQRLFHLTAADVRAPFGVDVVQVAPASVPLTFEQSLMKSVPVNARVEGEPAPGYVVGGITVEPAAVAIVGPAGALTALLEAVTEPVSIAGSSAPVKETATIGVADPTVRLREAQNAIVHVLIVRAPDEWTVSSIAVAVRNRAGDVTLKPGVVGARVRGPRNATNVDAARYIASVDVAGLTPGRYMRTVRVETPSGVGLLGVDPAEVAVTIR
jgi:YbbR domain-containing protein